MKDVLHKINKWLGRCCTTHTEETIRRLYTENVRLREEVKRLQGFTTVYIDPTIRAKGYAESAWNEPERNTEPTTRIMQAHGGEYFQQQRKQYEQKRRLHKHHLLQHSEPLAGDTLSMPATWML